MMNRKALLIGINNYPNGFELTGCVNDANQVKCAIERNGDNSPNFDVRLMEDVQTSKEVMAGIKQLFEGDGDSALLYFSGHGCVNDSSAEIVIPNDITSINYYTGIQMSTILNLVNKSKFRNKIIILDCCHSGNMGNKDVESTSCEISTGVSILAACKEKESAMEINGHGVFTEMLCQALSGRAADFCGNITIGGVYAYLDRSFGAWEQRPVFKTNVTEFAPLKKVNPQVPLDIIRELTTFFKNPQDEFQLDPSFEDTNTPTVKHSYCEPYARQDHVNCFKKLQKLQSIGFIEPVDEPFMYYAAMNNKSCRLTPLGQYYWQLVHKGRL